MIVDEKTAEKIIETLPKGDYKVLLVEQPSEEQELSKYKEEPIRRVVDNPCWFDVWCNDGFIRSVNFKFNRAEVFQFWPYYSYSEEQLTKLTFSSDEEENKKQKRRRKYEGVYVDMMSRKEKDNAIAHIEEMMEKEISDVDRKRYECYLAALRK